jgi:hypothetical protein
MRFLVRFFGALAVLAALGAGAARPAQAGVVLSDPLTSWPLNLGSQTQYVLLKNNAVHITEPGPYAAWVIHAGFNRE